MYFNKMFLKVCNSVAAPCAKWQLANDNKKREGHI